MMKCEHCGQMDDHTVNCVVNVANENVRLQGVIKRLQGHLQKMNLRLIDSEQRFESEREDRNRRADFWHLTAHDRDKEIHRLLDEIDKLRQEIIRWRKAAFTCAAYQSDESPQTPEDYTVAQIRALDKIIAKLGRAECERENWIATARTMQKNADYYRGLLEQIAKEFGDACYIDDTGKKTPDVFYCKVPEVVREKEKFWSHNWRNKVEVLKEIIQRCLPSLKAHSLDMEPFDEEQQKLLSDIREVLK